jgi:hypothetical protein
LVRRDDDDDEAWSPTCAEIFLFICYGCCNSWCERVSCLDSCLKQRALTLRLFVLRRPLPLTQQVLRDSYVAALDSQSHSRGRWD